ncbi:kinase-like domain-containing protein [Annulohypoxylon moriforme]|nr:kinase-like domain-containing protein [Annulohypoxylon moriforme]
MAIRRNRLTYSYRHAQKLGQGNEHDSFSNGGQSILTHNEVSPSNNRSPQTPQQTQYRSPEQQNRIIGPALSSTQASAFTTNNMYTTRSVPLSVRSERIGGFLRNDVFIFPPMPTPTNGSVCVCPYCFKPLSPRETTRESCWRSHFNEDIEPFVCISEECEDPLQFFSRLKDWETHMATKHSKEWTQTIHSTAWCCNIGECQSNPKIFYQRIDFEDHVQSKYGRNYSKAQVSALAMRKQTKACRDALQCPMCETVTDADSSLMIHIGAHMYHLAKYCILQADGFPEEALESNSNVSLDAYEKQDRGRQESINTDFTDSLTGIPSTGTNELDKQSIEGSDLDQMSPLENSNAMLLVDDEDRSYPGTDPEDFLDEIEEALDNALTISTIDPTRRYIPRHNITEILSPGVIQTILRYSYFKCLPGEDVLMQDIVGGVGRLKLLAILIKIKKVPDLPKYVEDGVDDECLPIPANDEEKLYCQRHKKYHQTMNAYFRPKVRIMFSQWSYALTAPFITHSHHILDPGHIFPMKGHKIPRNGIIQLSGNPMVPLVPEVNMDGGFSEVYRVHIEKSHYNFGELGLRHPDGLFALKKLHSNHEEEFNMELSTLLSSMDNASEKPIKHLTQLLATFEVSDPNSKENCPTYYLLFNWAENLPQFWKLKEEAYVRNRSHCKWMSQQFHEICLALQSVHNERERTLRLINDNDNLDLYGRHGDIKPDNFLWFRQEQSSDLLALSDFGLGRLHTQVSRSNQNPKALERTATYIAPEFDLDNGRISRASDIYSLGCVFLEYVTWFLRGYSCVLNEFPDRRTDKDIFTGWTSDKFFMIQVNEHSGVQTPIMKPQVRDWISELQQHEDCSWYLHQLLEIIRDKMLEPERTKRIDIAALADEMKILRMACDSDESYYLDAK